MTFSVVKNFSRDVLKIYRELRKKKMNILLWIFLFALFKKLSKTLNASNRSPIANAFVYFL